MRVTTHKRPILTNKIIPGLVVSLITLIPTWIAIGCYLVLGPNGFWQKLAAISIGVFFLGTVQLCLLIFGGYMLMVIVEDGWS